MNASANSALLSVTGVSKRFGPAIALDAVDLEIMPGEVLALAGANGSGKSTLIRTLAGIQSADSGVLRIGDHTFDLRRFDATAARRSGLRFVHQQSTLFPNLSVMDNLALGGAYTTSRTGGIKWRSMRRATSRVLDRFEIDARPDALVGDLSPAAQKMVEIARAVQFDDGRFHQCVLALDEPTAALPRHERTLLVSMLQRYVQECGQAVLLVTHHLEEVLSIADRIQVLRDGRSVGTVARQTLDKDSLTEMIVGRAVKVAHTTKSVPSDTEVLNVRGLSGGPVNNFDLCVRSGEIVGLAGIGGSGRSNLLRMLFGAQGHDAGCIAIGGRAVDVRNPADAIRAGFGYVSASRSRDGLLAGQSIAGNLSIVQVWKYWRRGWFSRGLELEDARVAMTEFAVKAGSPSAQMTTLSGGNQQKIMLARWIRLSRRVLLLDDPTEAVDVGARVELWQMIQQAAQNGTAFVVASDDVEELAHLCHRVLVVREGRPIACIGNDELDPETLNRNLHTLEVT
jgi:ribose transport system ATP-binding protein